MNRVNRRQLITAAIIAAAAAALAAAVLPFVLAPAERPAERPAADRLPPARFVGRQSCIECHRDEHHAWLGSDHERAMDHATGESILGDFDDTTFTHFGVASRFFREGDRFFVHTEGPDGEMADFEVEYTFGHDPLQQYLVSLPADDGRLQALTIAWDSRPEEEGGQRWFHLHGDEHIPPDDELHWTRRLHNWNHMCAQCHSTDVRKNYDVETDTFDTTFAEINVSCEACHGPGSNHVRWAEGELDALAAGESYGLTVRLKDEDNRVQVDACAPCHSRRHVVDADYVHGEAFLDFFAPELLREGLYHADGQILDEVFVYGSFLQSRMYHENVKCTDCHDPHTARLRATGNALCTQCHAPDERNPVGYDTPLHHFHEPGTAGASCVECHMPTETYMVVDPRRDHSFRAPRPDLSVTLGTPNACNECHDDRDAQWAADAVVEWYGEDRHDDPHYAGVLDAGRESNPEALGPLIELAQGLDRPAIIRATALLLLRGYETETATRAIARAVRDEDAIVRQTAAGGLARLPPAERVEAAAPLLGDAFRAVRTEAARVLSDVPADLLGEDRSAALGAALGEYLAGQRAQTDQPEARMNLGIIRANRGETERAIEHYRSAIELDETFVPARVNLADLYNAIGRQSEAEELFREAIELAPAFGEAYYSLGLLIAEDPQRLREAAGYLAPAVQLMPRHARAHYNLALALQHLGRGEEAEPILLRAHGLDPDSPDITHAIAVYYAQRGQWEEAERYARHLVRLLPDAPEARGLLELVRRRGR